MEPISNNRPNRQDPRGYRADMQVVDEFCDATKEPAENQVRGTVTDCLTLNVREEPDFDAAVLDIISALTEVSVDLKSSTDEFYKVRTAQGTQGFCMKKYIALGS